jgi:hypothetical protein
MEGLHFHGIIKRGKFNMKKLCQVCLIRFQMAKGGYPTSAGTLMG